MKQIPHCLGVAPHPYFTTIKSHKRHFFKGQKRRQNIQDSQKNSESKKEIFTKHPQVKFYLIGTFSDLDLCWGEIDTSE